MRSEMTELWAITAYFNPAHYERRLANYRTFRKHLAVPLVAVEVSFDDPFQLVRDDADILIQLRGKDAMWQKERLLNIALGALPPSCTKVAWLDSDVVFQNDRWAELAGRRLDEVAILQLFRYAWYLPKEAPVDRFETDDAETARLSIASLSSSGVPASIWSTTERLHHSPPAVGLAWAARRDLLERHGFYDACIIGGGDRALIAAADGSTAELTASRHMAGAFERHYLCWAEPFRNDFRNASGFIEGDVFHLWHGSLRNRAYKNRHEGLRRFDFDPSRDIALDDNGTWRWASDKHEMHAFVRDYLMSRREDG